MLSKDQGGSGPSWCQGRIGRKCPQANLGAACLHSPERLTLLFGPQCCLPTCLPRALWTRAWLMGMRRRSSSGEGARRTNWRTCSPLTCKWVLGSEGQGPGCWPAGPEEACFFPSPPTGSLLWEGAAGPEPEGPVCSWHGPARLWIGNPQSQGGWRLREEGTPDLTERSVMWG